MLPEIIYTRACSSDFVLKWRSRGLVLRSVPLIRIRGTAPGVHLPILPEKLIFTSQHAVQHFFQRKERLSQLQPGIKIACIGQKTYKCLRNEGLIPNLWADSADQLLEKILRTWPPQPVLYVCGSQRREVIPGGLLRAGFSYQELQVYTTTLLSPEIAWQEAMGIVFFSPSGVSSYCTRNTIPAEARVWAIGPTTAEALMQQKIQNVYVPDKPVPETLLEDILQYATSPGHF